MKTLLVTLALISATPIFGRPHIGKLNQDDTLTPYSHQTGEYRKFHDKKDVTTEIVTDLATVLVPEYVVWVNKDGQPVSTETRSGSVASATPAPTTSSTPSAVPTEGSAPAPVPSSSTTPSINIPTTSSQAVATTSSSSVDTTVASTTAPTTISTAYDQGARVGPPAPAPVTTSPTDQPPDSTSPTVHGTPNQHASSDGPIFGLAYDILNGSPGQCKTQTEVLSELAFFRSKSFTHIRIYDIDCNQVNMVTSAAAANGLYVIVTVPDPTTLSTTLPELISQAGGNLDRIDTIAIGNEYVNSGGSVQDVLNGLSYARTFLGSAGFTGSIVTIDTCNAIEANTSLCEYSDYVAANCHAFFNPTISAPGAGSTSQVRPPTFIVPAVASESSLLNLAGRGKAVRMWQLYPQLQTKWRHWIPSTAPFLTEIWSCSRPLTHHIRVQVSTVSNSISASSHLQMGKLPKERNMWPLGAIFGQITRISCGRRWIWRTLRVNSDVGSQYIHKVDQNTKKLWSRTEAGRCKLLLLTGPSDLKAVLMTSS